MTDPLPPSAQRVQDAADALALAITVRVMAEPTRTAEEAAAACGVTVGQIVKSLLFVGAESGKPYLLLVSGANRVNERGIAAHLGEKLRRPDADAVRTLTGYAIGGIPPFGHDTPFTTYIRIITLTKQMPVRSVGNIRSACHGRPSQKPHFQRRKQGSRLA